MAPCFAYMALWMIVGGNLAKLCLAQAALLRNTPDPSMTANILDVVASDSGWRLEEGARLKAAYNFVSDEWVVGGGIGGDMCCAVACIAGAPVMHLVYKLLKLESKQHMHPSLNIGKHNETDAEHLQEPAKELPSVDNSIAMALVSCGFVNEAMDEAVQVHGAPVSSN